jgi:zinc transport system permease protein
MRTDQAAPAALARKVNSVVPEFWQALTQHAFLRNALLAGLLASLACGVVGTFVVTRRITVIAGSLAHSVLGGMGAAYYFRSVHGWQWLHPLHGAMVAALLAALIIGLVRAKSREREDTVISALWAVGMAVGVLFLFRTPGYKADLMTYLFGNVIMVDPQTLRLLVGLDGVILLLTLLFYNPLLAVCFDEEFARLRGINVSLFYTLLLCLTALTIVTLIYVVGIVMVIALITLPVSVAGRFARKLWQMMALAAALSALLTTAGLVISFDSDLPVGATTILLAAAVYLVVHLGAGIWQRRVARRA